ncbi:MAG: FtsX-like permease family protein [Bulleidia sp.]|nr:FtsX-like permease family protein [Bulleidia sp.]
MRFFYPRLACLSIQKNKQYYFPYILAGILMCSMTYIMNFLNVSTIVSSMTGGAAMQTMFGFGMIVVSVLSAFFLFYANSFLVKIREKELGLYAILGMNRGNIICLVLIESLLVMCSVIAGGLLLGVVLSKLVELVLFTLCHAKVSTGFYFNSDLIANVAVWFAGIYTILFVYSAIRIRAKSALHLMHSTSYGEKAPKSNMIFALIGVVILGVAYYMAVTIESPIKALQTFFIAVLLVIVATYILFTVGSVALCKVLEKNKNYYYNPNHFVSVGTMCFRMKRNGAGLASICILITMVMVVASVSFSAYTGIQDSVNRGYPKDVLLEVGTNKDVEQLRDLFQQFVQENNAHMVDGNYVHYRETLYGSFTKKGYASSNTFTMDRFTVIDLDTYNQLTKQNESLNDDECLLVSKSNVDYQTFQLDQNQPLKVKEIVKESLLPDANTITGTSVTLVVKDLGMLTYQEGTQDTLSYFANVEDGYTIDRDALIQKIGFLMKNSEMANTLDFSYMYSVETKQAALEAYYTLFGGIIVLGGLLSIVFLASAVLIIYYKQIVEGLEDSERFRVLRKVGMEDTQIKKTINEQILLVFFMPLALAGLHLICAYPMISKLMVLFTITDMTLIKIVTCITFVMIGVFYGIVYKLTSHMYYKIIRS